MYIYLCNINQLIIEAANILLLYNAVIIIVLTLQRIISGRGFVAL